MNESAAFIILQNPNSPLQQLIFLHKKKIQSTVCVHVSAKKNSYSKKWQTLKITSRIFSAGLTWTH